MAMPGQTAQDAGFGQQVARLAIEFGAVDQIIDIAKRRAPACRHDSFGGGLRHAAQGAQT